MIQKMKTSCLLAALCVVLAGCPQAIPVVQGVLNAAQWVGSVIEVADQAQRSWFSLSPDRGKQLEVERAVLRSRKALAALNDVALAAKSLDDNNLVAARADLMQAYKELEELLASLSAPTQPGMKPLDPPRIVESARIAAALNP